MKSKMIKAAIACVTLYLASCQVAQESNYDDLIKAAVNNPARAEANSSRDAARKPGEIIKFMGVKPGMTVLDMVSNGGFYAEILAGVVGNEGRVIAHTFARNETNPDFAYAKYIRDSEHMANVALIYADFDALDIKENTLDRIFIVQNYHDLYFDREGYGVDDIQSVLVMLRKGLKPGGIMAVIDHDANKGAPSSTGTTLHRISSDIVKADMAQAGFELEGSLDVLLNDTDDKSKGVFDPAVRGKTSRFILRFKNPE